MGATFDSSLTIYISCCLDYGTVATNNHKLTVVIIGSAAGLCYESCPPPSWGRGLESSPVHFQPRKGWFQGTTRRAWCVFLAGREHHPVTPDSCQQWEEVKICSQGRDRLQGGWVSVEQATRVPGPSWRVAGEGRDSQVRVNFEQWPGRSRRDRMEDQTGQRTQPTGGMARTSHHRIQMGWSSF